MRRAALAGALIVAISGPASAAAAPIDATTAADGRLKISLPGGEKLTESGFRGAGAGGRLGFLSGGTWYHATGRGNGGELLTDDPDGRRIALEVRGGRGTLGITARVLGEGSAPVESIGVGFRAPKGERMLGFGERSNRVDQRGNTVENYVGEGPYQPAEYPIIAATVPPWGVHDREDASYFPMPWLLSSRGYGVLAKNPETSRFHLASIRGDEWSFEVDSARMSLRVIAGPTPAAAVRRLTRITGRQPKPAAPWLFGPWVQTGHQNTAPDELANLGILRDADAPVSVAETHMRYMPCGSDVGQEASEAQRTAGLHDLGLAAITYTREAICSSYPEPFERAVATDAILEKPDGTPYTFQGFVGSGVTQIGMFDFTDPDAGPIYRSILDRAYTAGYDGWMEDYGEYAPPDSVFDNGMTGRRGHNLHPVYYHRAGWRYAKSKERPIVRFIRSGMDRRAPLRADRLGRRPDDRLGLRRPRLLGPRGADDGPLRHLHLGLRHRRLLHPLRPAAGRGAARPLARVRRLLRRHADEGRGHRRAAPRRGRRSGRRRRCRSTAATPSSAPSSTPTWSRPIASTGGVGCRSCGTSRSSTPTTAARCAARTSSSSAPT